MNGDIEKLQRIFDVSRRIVFFGGAGVSTESGLKDFRSPDGLYAEKYKFPPEYMLSHDCFVRHTEEFFAFYREKLLPEGIKPNAAHFKLAESKNVLELHGSVLRNYCTRCGAFYDEKFMRAAPVPKCSKCGGIVKPDVVLYGESLDERVLEDSVRAIREADTLIVAGTSLAVYPAAGLINYFYGDNLIVINRDPVEIGGALFIKGKVGEILSQIEIR